MTILLSTVIVFVVCYSLGLLLSDKEDNTDDN